jgi:hypothetical protein
VGECWCSTAAGIECEPCEKKRLRAIQRTPAEEAVLRAAVACRRAGSNNWAAWMDLANAVDALLRENPAWGEEGKG